MALFKCKMCGGTIEFETGATVGVCDSCGTKQTLPRLDDDRRANLYDRANHFRRNSEFDRASAIYEQILEEDTEDAEAYWSLVLCRYGVEYVDDPDTHQRVPTVNRTQYTSVFDDENYISALKFSDLSQREIYAKEAAAINRIQKGILAISQNEEPFDVFICYKETDGNGERTRDSVLANEIYNRLVREDFRVFYSRITLEDKLGAAYEPYIFSAINSAQVMIVLGTKPEFFNAPWVKNEWSRFLALVKKSGGKKVLIPAYRDMDPYDIPEAFSHLQALDMSKIGFMEDLVHGIRKIVVKDTQVPADATASYSEGIYLAALKTMSEKRYDEALKLFSTITEYKDSYAKSQQCRQLIKEASDKAIYERAINLYNSAASVRDYRNVANLMNKIADYKDAVAIKIDALKQAELKQHEEVYLKACSLMNTGNIRYLMQADKLLATIPDYRDSSQKRNICAGLIKREQEQLAIRSAQASAHRKKIAKTVIIAVAASIVALIVTIIAVISIYKSIHSPSRIVIEMKSDNSEYDGNYKVYLDYTITNNTSVKINYIAITAYLTDQSGKQLGWVTSEFGDDNLIYSSGQTLELKPRSTIIKSSYLSERRLESSNDMFIYLYNNGTEDLEITYKITKVKWSDGYVYGK